jgi:uncharacterized GH25 family protein
MTEQLDGTIIDQDGAPVAAATIEVRDDAGSLVTLTDADGNSEANPLTTDSNGAYDVQVPTAGTYYLTVTKGQAETVLTKILRGTVTVVRFTASQYATGPQAARAKFATSLPSRVVSFNPDP